MDEKRCRFILKSVAKMNRRISGNSKIDELLCKFTKVFTYNGGLGPAVDNDPIKHFISLGGTKQF